jgi:RNA polymerase sigma-70 factor (ECF subfamily)
MGVMTSTRADERALIAGAQAGDERAFMALVDPYRRVLEIHCYRMLGSRHDAEDVVQETLLLAWRSLGRFERRASVSTWLYRIATNACLDELEKRPRREVEPYPDSRLEDADTSIADPAARYALHEGMELAFLTAIQRLPGRQRAVLILRDVLGWSAGESAELLDTTVTAVNSALQRARATIEAEAPAHRVAPGRGRQRELLRRYVDAWERTDMGALVTLLREDAVMTMPPQPAVAGALEIIAFFDRQCGVQYRPSGTWVNGVPAVELWDEAGHLHRLLILDVQDDQVARIYAYAPLNAETRI